MTVICPFCGKESYGLAYCDYCGAEIPKIKPQPVPLKQPKPQAVQHQSQQPMYQHNQNRGISCKNCGSNNISVQMIQTNAKTSHNARGCLWELMRLFLIFMTCGLWLIIGKSKGKSKTKIKNQKMCVCQSCGYSWKI